MACSIQITNIQGIEFDNENAILKLRVSGTASECNEVIINVTNSQPVTSEMPEKQVSVNNGTWEVEYNINTDFSHGEYICGRNKGQIEVRCAHDSNCVTGTSFDVIQCGAEASCPNYIFSLVSIGSCNENLQRRVEFTIQVNNPSDPLVYELGFGDGVDETVVFDANENSRTFVHYYSGGNYEITIHAVLPENCPSISFPLQVEDCKVDCAEIDLKITYEDGTEYEHIEGNLFQEVGQSEILSCLPEGEYTLEVLSPIPADVEWSYNEGIQSTQLIHTIVLNSEEEISVHLRVEKLGCDPKTKNIEFRACDYEEPGQDDGLDPSDGIPEIPDDGPNPEDAIPEIPDNGNDSDDPNDNQDEDEPVTPPPPNSDNRGCLNPCIIWFLLNIALFIGTGVFILITFCMLEASFWSALAALGSGGTLAAVTGALSTANIIMLIISLVLVIVSIISFILWAIICGFRLGDMVCRLLEVLMNILGVATSISFLLAIIFVIIGRFGCAVGGIIDVAWFGILMSITWWIGRYILNCFR